MTIEPFAIDIPDAVLDDLRARLERTQLPSGFAGDGWRAGVDLDYLRELLDYWIGSFDWRAREREINRYPQFRAMIDGIPVHFLHARGTGPQPLPLVLTHGWPWTFWDFEHVIGPLTDPAAYGGEPGDAFDLVVPSLPGFVFSTPLPRPVDWQATADLWARLMRELDYERFGASGGDYGRIVTLQLGHKYAERVVGAHIYGTRGLGTWNVERPWDLAGPVPDDLPALTRAMLLGRQRRFSAHVTVQVLDPQSLAVGLHDSPAGLCAWLVVRRRNWSDCAGDVEMCFSKDELLTHVMLYWATQSFWTSARYYYEAANRPWRPAHDRTPPVLAPTGVSVFLNDEPIPRTDTQLAQEVNLRFRRDHERGGHFAPAERPETIVEDIRDFFRPLR